MPIQKSAGWAILWNRLLWVAGVPVLLVAMAPQCVLAAPSVADVTKPGVVQQRKQAASTHAPRRRLYSRAPILSARPSAAQLAGLHQTHDELSLRSSVALVVDQETQEVLLSKNEQAVLPIASLSKLMTGLVVRESMLPMDEMIGITQADVDTEKGSTSRLRVGTELSRAELLHLALMSSENRAANALGRSHPGGLQAFVGLMNEKARALGMHDTSFVEPTGLSSKNQSSAKDLAVLVKEASRDPILSAYSTSPSYRVAVGRRNLQFSNTNWLVRSPFWEIGLQKTGYISEAGQCLVLQATVAGRKLIMVFLDSVGRRSRLADAERVRRWVESTPVKSLSPVTSLPAELHAFQSEEAIDD